MENGIDGRGWPLPPKPWLYSERIIDAMAAAAQIHGRQKRKATEIPYLSHLLGTCSIALEYGATEDEAIAALLHDAIEDGQPTDAARATVWRSRFWILSTRAPSPRLARMARSTITCYPG